MASDKTTDKIGLRYGFFAGIFMIVYFLILTALGINNKEEARMAGFIFIILAVMMAIVKYKRVQGNVMPYLPGLGIGFVIGLVGSLLYGIFIMIYTSYVDAEYQNTLRTDDYFGSLSPVILCMAFALMGLVIGAFTAYILMMLYDKSGGRTADKNI
ncbi:MAG: hypothetical protein COW65_08490 [Cytophagales bacterium CG18_big_fil_WC_8_21_14_2_50_42_9]|nr:MAG: hypothetical protein COW65_08490 [Cytophagales bacterium CG18_big_fil_WC_8_21_14_2_50_42_9]